MTNETDSDRSSGKRSAPQRATLTVDETAAYMGLGRGTTYDAIRRGEIPHVRVGGRILIPRAALDRLLLGDIEIQTREEA